MRTEDGALVYKSLNGEPEMFGILVDKYKASVYALVYTKLRNFHDAEDVTQEVFLQAFKNLRKLKNFDSFAVWLSSIASNLSKKWVRSNIRRIDNVFIEDKDPKIMEMPSTDSYRDNEISESLHEAIASLPEIYQQALTLHYLGGMSGMEIAVMLGISHDTVRQRLSRAREQLKEEMIAMMSQTFKQQKLSASFTFRIVEMVKKIRINPVSDAKSLPWGLSLGAGIILAVLMLGQHIIISLPDIAMGLPLPSDTKILKVGEIPVEAVEVSTIASIASKGDGKGFAPDPKGQENALFMAPQAEVKWTKKADMPTARTGLVACILDGKIFTFGGSSKLGALASVEEYDPATDKWTKKQDMPVSRTWHQVCIADGKVYIIGDMFDRTSLLEYNPLKDTWVKKTDMPTPRMLFSSCVIDGMIYVFSGSLGNGAEKPNVEVYDPSKDEWTKKKDMPIAREGASASVVKGKVYIIGGWKPPNQALNTVEEYDPIKDEWKNKSPIQTARIYHSACVINDKIYVIGGCKIDDQAISEVEVYDPATDTCEKVADISEARCFFSTAEFDGRIFVIGGSPIFWDFIPKIDPLSTVEEFDTGFISKSVDPSGKLPQAWGTLKVK